MSHSDYESCEYFDDENCNGQILCNCNQRRDGSVKICEISSDENIPNVENIKKKRTKVLNKSVEVMNKGRTRLLRRDLSISDEELLVSSASSINSNSYSNASLESNILTPSCETLVTKTYYRRFWILFVFSLYSFFTCVQWNAWGPISASMIEAFPDWSYRTVAWMESLVTIMFVVFMLPVCWATGRFGLRNGILFSTMILAIGLGMRCITDESRIFTILCHICSVMLGFSTTVVLSAPSMVASEWFPPRERTTATAVIMAASQLGSVGSYLEPLVVQQPANNVSPNAIKADIMKLMYIMAGIGGMIFMLILAYFPSKPPIPPSIASSRDRHSFAIGFLALLRDKNLMTLILIYGVASGPALGWVGMLNYSLIPLGFDQNECMRVGLIGVFSCFVSSVITGLITDHIYGYLRETIIILLLGAASSFYWFLLITENVISLVTWQVYVSVSLGLSLHYATVTLFYELASEMAYPAPEVLIGGFITSADCLSTSAFLYIYLFNNIGYNWVTYVLVASNALPVLPLVFIKDGYRRSKLDRSKIKTCVVV